MEIEELYGELPRILTAAMRVRVTMILRAGCSGWRCPGTEPRFTRRLINANVTVHIQCMGCGRSMSGGLKRADFAHWQDFHLWDDTPRERLDAELESERQAGIQRSDEVRERLDQAIAQRRTDYARWLLASPDWQRLRDRVWIRAGGNCEACLNARAKDVHHITYHLGRLPPAWELRAVCRACHDRLHDWTGGEE